MQLHAFAGNTNTYSNVKCNVKSYVNVKYKSYAQACLSMLMHA